MIRFACVFPKPTELPMRSFRRSLLFTIGFLSLTAAVVPAAEPETAAERGWRWLTTKPYLPADFTDGVFEQLWTVWPESLREQARTASAAERRRMSFERYGLVERPGGDGTGPALGYVADGQGGWVMNCLACHNGTVEGRMIPGVPNSLYALETLTDEVRAVKTAMKIPLGHMELGGSRMPLGTTRGTTNSVMFGVALGALRDRDLNVTLNVRRPKFVHHDMDAPAFWNTGRKKYLYCDGFVEKTPRPLLQFVMVVQNSGSTMRGWEPEFADILAWIESLTPPRYSGNIDMPLAVNGGKIFDNHCARCHGTYGENGKYPEKVIPLADVGTDPVRLSSLPREYRESMKVGWYGESGKRDYNLDPKGYVAPPLNGIWASAPYFHNGSVPTLWHLLHPGQRPVVWRRALNGYDHVRMGLDVVELEAVPSAVQTKDQRREYFDTRKPGKSAAGHQFPDELTEDEKQAVLEYLKTL